MLDNQPVRFSFEEWTLDTGTRQLARRGRPVRLSPKGFDLLSHLLDRRPEACSKSDLHDALWPDTVVSEATLASLVAEVRTALRDKARKPRFVRTVHGFGYAFCGEAFEESAGEPVQKGACFRLTVGRREVDLRQGENVLGRTRDAVAWVEGSSVSRRHARIVIRGDEARLEDLGSKNGTFLRGLRLEGAAPLHDGDAFRLGDEWLTIRRFTGEPTDTSGSSSRG